MSRTRFFDTDIPTTEGQAEILSAWDAAELDLLQAAWIMKLSVREVPAVATVSRQGKGSADYAPKGINR